MAHTCSPSTQEAESGGLPKVGGQPSLPSSFQDSLSYRVKAVQKQEQQKGSITKAENDCWDRV